MPIPVYMVNILGKGGGRSAVGMSAYGSGKTLRITSTVAAASYRAGQPLRDHQMKRTFDYSGREDVRYEAILAPPHVPQWMLDREQLWNSVEILEAPIQNARLARSIVIAMPRELSIEQNIDLLREHVQEVFVSKGMIADCALHCKESSDGGLNPHAHIMLSLHEVLENGEWKKTKNREWDGWETYTQKQERIAAGLPNLMEQWRFAWEATQNAYLEAAESDARVDMRSYRDQGLNRVPQFHHGVRVSEIERSGEETRAIARNQETAQENYMRAMLDAAQPSSLDALREGMEPNREMALMHPDEIMRMDEVTLEEELEREGEAGRER